jgi:hypothetical protein
VGREPNFASQNGHRPVLTNSTTFVDAEGFRDMSYQPLKPSLSDAQMEDKLWDRNSNDCDHVGDDDDFNTYNATKNADDNRAACTNPVDIISRFDWKEEAINPQRASLLCSGLPYEIRREIWTMTLLPYQNTRAPILAYDSYAYRPSTEFPMIQAVFLLRICRLIYSESHDLPVSLRTFISWLLAGEDRRPHNRSHSPGFHRLSPKDLQRVRYFHAYAAQADLERPEWVQSALTSSRFTEHPLVGKYICTLYVTIRHTDFWWWERDNILRMDHRKEYNEQWRSGLDVLPNLEKMVFDLETLERRADEMDALVKEVKEWKIALKDKRILSSDGIPVQTHTWVGTSRFSGGQRVPVGTSSLSYYVATITWKAPKAVAAVSVSSAR